MKTILSLAAFAVLGAAGGAHADIIDGRTDERAMLTGRLDIVTEPLVTVGEDLADGYLFTGIPDGIGAYALDADTVRLLVNHEFGSSAGAPWTLANGASFSAGARVSFVDVDRASRGVVGGGLAIERVIDWAGVEIDSTNVGDFGNLSRLCSSALFGSAEGFSTDIYFTGEESAGGRGFALNTDDGTLHEVGAFGNGRWESFTVLPTVGTTLADHTVMILADDAEARPCYLYVGLKDAKSADFLARNGLADGQLFVLLVDGGARSNVDFLGTGFTDGVTFEPISSNDPSADRVANEAAMVAEARDMGAFLFSRPEDLAFDPTDATSGRFVFASTGRVASIETALGTVEIDDPWGTTYLIELELDSLLSGTITGSMVNLYDGNDEDKRDFGLRSPDNLDWADDGFIYVQEDRSVGGFGADSGMEASIWRLAATAGGSAERVGMIDRSAVPDGQTDIDPDDLGDWESSGILDISTLFGEAGGTLFVFDVQAHSLRGGIIDSANLVQGGQLLFATRAEGFLTGDRDGDGRVDGADLAALLGLWATDDQAADLDDDRNVSGSDLAVLLSNWVD